METNKIPSNPRLRNLDGNYAYEERQEDYVSLRDEIAMRAMQGHLASEYGAMVHSDDYGRKALAQEFYKIADEMLKVREETKLQPE